MTPRALTAPLAFRGQAQLQQQSSPTLRCTACNTDLPTVFTVLRYGPDCSVVIFSAVLDLEMKTEGSKCLSNKALACHKTIIGQELIYGMRNVRKGEKNLILETFTGTINRVIFTVSELNK